MAKIRLTFLLIFALCYMSVARPLMVDSSGKKPLMRILLDTDANNELDDQHAMAYLLFSGQNFEVAGITVNATFGGGAVEHHLAEAKRILQLCGLESQVPLLRGANAGFETLFPHLKQEKFDGFEAVDFIVQQAHAMDEQPLLVMAIGKLTNVALALAKNPEIASLIKIVWLGSHYPGPGEYNLLNDVAALQYILLVDVPFEMVTVRTDGRGGSHEVQVSIEEIQQKMPGLGVVSGSVAGRHGGEFRTFGDYSVDLFEKSRSHGNSSYRPLFDVVALAVVKNPLWGNQTVVRGLQYGSDGWRVNPDLNRAVTIWDEFSGQHIINDFFTTMQIPQLVKVSPLP